MSEQQPRNRYPALPPPPDSQTGEPFPPHGLGFRGDADKPVPEHDPYRETRLSDKPEPPEGMGPVLAWYKESKRGKLIGFLGGFAVLVTGATLISYLNGDGAFDWVKYWQAWVILSVGCLLATGPLTYLVYSAGADWFKFDVVKFGIRRRSTVIKLYDLKKITAEFGATEFYLKLSDGKNSLDLTFLEFHYDRRIWDLVYNGILHSVAAGAQLNNIALERLELDQVPQLRDPTGHGSDVDDEDSVDDGDDAAGAAPDWARRVGPDK